MDMLVNIFWGKLQLIQPLKRAVLKMKSSITLLMWKKFQAYLGGMYKDAV